MFVPSAQRVSSAADETDGGRSMKRNGLDSDGFQVSVYERICAVQSTRDTIRAI